MDRYQVCRVTLVKASADGEVVWSWRPDAGAKFSRKRFRESDGGKRARSPGRARYKPLKPLRREGRMIRHHLWRLPCAFYHCTRAAGASWHPVFPAPSAFRGWLTVQLGRIAPRDTKTHGRTRAQ